MSIRRIARVVEAGMRDHPRAAVVGRIVTLENAFIGAQLWKILSLMMARVDLRRQRPTRRCG